MTRNCAAERHIRAIAAVHVLAGVAFTIVFALLAMPVYLAMLKVALMCAGLLFAGLAVSLWFFGVVSKWLTILLAAVTSVVSVYEFIKYEVDKIRIEANVLHTGAISFLYKYIGYSVAEFLLAGWCVLIMVTLLRRSSREVFAGEYKTMLHGEKPLHTPFYTSPLFITGLVVYITLAVAISR